jgi:putative adenylate-forming enzyme
MDIAMAARLLVHGAILQRRERWDAERILGYREAQLRALRRFALARSPFYARFHRNCEAKPLAELPILTKGQLMDAYDDLVTDRRVHLAAVRAHIAGAPTASLFDGRYRVCATSGTSGHPGVFLYDAREWAWVLAAYARANRWAGIPAGLFHRLRLAIVGSSRPWHSSNAVTASLDCAWVPSLRLSATDPLVDTCRRLSDWKPTLLIAYSALSGVLAEEQLAGRLAIAPRAVMCVAETLTRATRARVRHAWGTEPFENYAATEAACIAAECRHHGGMHLFDDLLVVEVVDEKNRPVPSEEMGAKVLVSVLFSRTLPLIRYELDDAVMLRDGPCPCGLPFRRLTRLGGRIAETLRIPRKDGSTALLHPTLFEDAIGLTEVRGWQVLRRGECLDVRLLGPVSADLRRQIAARLRQLMAAAGIDHLHLTLTTVDVLPRTPSGKMLLVHDAAAA